MSEQYKHITANVSQNVLVLSLNMKSLQDYEVAQEVQSEFAAALSDSGTNKVVLDLGQLEFLASVGFWPFVGLYHKVRESEGKLVVCNISEFIEQVFKRTRLLVNPSAKRALFEKADSLDEAIAMLNEER